MKKIMTMFLSAALAISATAQIANPLAMVASADDLNRYAMGLIDNGYTVVNSPGLVNEVNTTNYVWATVGNEEDKLVILDQLNTRDLSFSLSNPSEDEFYLFTWISDSRGNTLYNGSSNSGKLEMGKAGWRVPKAMLAYKLQIAWRIPIYIDGIVSAKLLIRDEEGNLLRIEYPEIWGGGFFFESQYAGAHGELAVTTEINGVYKTIVAPLRRGDGDAVIPEVFTIPLVNVSIDGVYDLGWSLLYTDILQVRPETINGEGTPPVVRLRTDSAKQFFMVAQTTEGENPSILYARNISTGEELTQTVSNYYSVVSLPNAGLWELWFDWPTLDREVFQSWWGDGGGKGKPARR